MILNYFEQSFVYYQRMNRGMGPNRLLVPKTYCLLFWNLIYLSGKSLAESPESFIFGAAFTSMVQTCASYAVSFALFQNLC